MTSPRVSRIAATGRFLHLNDYRRVMSVTHLPATASAEEVHDVLHRDAAVILDDLADIDLIDRIADEMKDHVAATPAGTDDFAGRVTRRTGGLVGRSPSSHEVIQHPLILDVVSRLLHRAKNYQLHLTQLITI
ncbi:MAG: hypothetical protein DRJ50_02650, partial [Actinobacteria bacterium]